MTRGELDQSCQLDVAGAAKLHPIAIAAALTSTSNECQMRHHNMCAAIQPETTSSPAMDQGPAVSKGGDPDGVILSPTVLLLEGQRPGKRLSTSKEELIAWSEISPIGPSDASLGLFRSHTRILVVTP